MLFTFYAHKHIALGTYQICNLIAKLRLTQFLWIRTYKFYYFDSFSTLAKSLSSFCVIQKDKNL